MDDFQRYLLDEFIDDCRAFFDDTGDRYDGAAATDAWTRGLAWFHEYLPPAA